MRSYRKNSIWIFVILLVVCLYFEYNDSIRSSLASNKKSEIIVNSSIPDYSGKDVIVLNNNEPDFDDLAKTTNSFEVYSELDKLGRCGSAYANIGYDLMPTDKRERIGSVKPS